MTELPDYSHALADPGPEPVTEETFFDQGKQLPKILAWARARRVAPWALFFAILIRVSASTPHTVRLPGLIGGQASLNLFCAFVSRSGGGKGISDKVAREAWPTTIAIRMLGSGEGIPEMFVLRGPETEDNERLTAAILSVNEIDTLTGLASRQGSIILAQLKSAWMGEPLGQSNASKATSRHVDEHSYRLCMSVGCQYGHGGVIFADTSGGTPQRFLWAPTEDPGMPYGGGPDPEPLDTAQAFWRPDEHGVTEIAYGIPEIEKTVIGAHLARQRGEADALNGHALLSRCKVAAVIAIMHQRAEVTQLDWELSGIVMAVSDRTRASLLEYDRQASRAKIRERAVARAVGEEFYDSSRLETVKRSILRMLERDGEQAGGDLRRRLGRREKRELFDQAIALLDSEGSVSARPGEHNSVRYRIGSRVTIEVTPNKASSEGVTTAVTRDRSGDITDLDSRRSRDEPPPKLSCQKWFDNHIAGLRAAGETTAESSTVFAAGEAAGHSRQALRIAASVNKHVQVISRRAKNSTWDITGTARDPYQSATRWTNEYLASLPAGMEVDKPAFKKAAAAAGYTWAATRNAATESGLIESLPGVGTESIWRIAPNNSDREEGTA